MEGGRKHPGEEDVGEAGEAWLKRLCLNWNWKGYGDLSDEKNQEIGGRGAQLPPDLQRHWAGAGMVTWGKSRSSPAITEKRKAWREVGLDRTAGTRSFSALQAECRFHIMVSEWKVPNNNNRKTSCGQICRWIYEISLENQTRVTYHQHLVTEADQGIEKKAIYLPVCLSRSRSIMDLRSFPNPISRLMETIGKCIEVSQSSVSV